MANPEHLAILKQGVEVWNRWVHEQGFYFTPELEGANLCGMDLRSVNLMSGRLHGANLAGVRLDRSDLSGAYFDNADLSGADISASRIYNAVFDFANLSGARLHVMEFVGTELDGAQFQNAIFGHTTFANCDLSRVRGLESIKHEAPSFITLDTIYKSRGKIPESFLRGCGVPESFITQMHALVGAEDGIQFYSCFISYSTKDEEFAKRLHGKMRDAHLRVWFAPEDMKAGRKLHEQIETAIRIYDKLLIVLSEASLQSEWVMTELRKAFKAERREGRRKLFPVRLVDMETIRAWECFDADSGKDLATELREYFIPDFSDWKNHDAFESAFARLLQDLRTDERVR